MEEIMLADATLQSLCKQIDLFERAARYNGRPRERIVALGEAEELYYRLYPHHYRALQTIRVASQLANPVAKRQDPFQKCESRLISLLVNTILDGVQCRDLCLRNAQRPEELAFTLWVLAFGTRALMDSRVATSQLGIEDGFRVVRHNTGLLMDALGWQPLSTEWDYNMTIESVRKELFAEELNELSQSVGHQMM
jgi:hypothetical protein